MTKQEEIDNVVGNYCLELLGDKENGYILVPSLDEGTIFYQAWMCIDKQTTYRILNPSLKTWEKRAEKFHDEIRKYI